MISTTRSRRVLVGVLVAVMTSVILYQHRQSTLAAEQLRTARATLNAMLAKRDSLEQAKIVLTRNYEDVRLPVSSSIHTVDVELGASACGDDWIEAKTSEATATQHLSSGRG